MIETIEQMYRQLKEATEPRALLEQARQLSRAIGRLPPSMADKTRDELSKLFSSDVQGNKGATMDAASFRMGVSEMALGVLRGQLHSNAYGTPEAVKQKNLQEEVLVLLHGTVLAAARSRDAWDGLTLAQLAQHIGMSVEELSPALHPILYDSRHEGNGESCAQDPELLTVEVQNGTDVIVLTAEGSMEGERLYLERAGDGGNAVEFKDAAKTQAI